MHPLIEKAKQEGRPLLETEALSLLNHYGISVPEHRFARTEQETLEACQDLGWPVVIKVVSPDVLHKTEVGGVILNVKNKRQATKAFSQTHGPRKGRTSDPRGSGLPISGSRYRALGWHDPG